MAIKKTLGGDRLGAGKKMRVNLKAYERSTFNLSYDWKSSMSCGTLVPFMKYLAMNGDTFDINLNALIKTKPTIAPLFGTFKVQLDVFACPIRLYNGLLHNNAIKIGMDMAQVKLPKLAYTMANIDDEETAKSSLIRYLGISGWGDYIQSYGKARKINAVPLLAYYDIFKNYYSNKQETNAYIIKGISNKKYIDVGASTFDYYFKTYNSNTKNYNIYSGEYTEVLLSSNALETGTAGVLEWKLSTYAAQENITFDEVYPYLLINEAWWTGDSKPNMIKAQDLQDYAISHPEYNMVIELNPGFSGIRITYEKTYEDKKGDTTNAYSAWNQNFAASRIYLDNVLSPFNLQNIDAMRETILRNTGKNIELIINDTNIYPYTLYGDNDDSINTHEQGGLLLKTYQSDLFNNWLSSETIEGLTGIQQLTAVSTESGNFTMDALLLAKKVYNMLNLIAAAGGTYEDWQEARYGVDAIRRAESPIYCGGMSYELGFEEVVSTADTETTGAGDQPLGSLAGKGNVFDRKGGDIIIKVDEPSYIIGIVSITPRICYSQGNDWDINIDNLNDLHAPELDGIGFQDLIEEQLAWWTTTRNNDGTIVQKAAGKQPAWINYMTAVSKVYGDFADELKAGYMVLDRKYKRSEQLTAQIEDLTTYIDPTKYNYAFADSSIEMQPFWVQIAVNCQARRKMSAKLIPTM